MPSHCVILGLKLIGFKKKSEVKLHLHVKPSHFIYPDESVCIIIFNTYSKTLWAICFFMLYLTLVQMHKYNSYSLIMNYIQQKRKNSLLDV